VGFLQDLGPLEKGLIALAIIAVVLTVVVPGAVNPPSPQSEAAIMLVIESFPSKMSYVGKNSTMVTVSNTGGQSATEVKVTISNGVTGESKPITLNAGASERLTIDLIPDKKSNYGRKLAKIGLTYLDQKGSPHEVAPQEKLYYLLPNAHLDNVHWKIDLLHLAGNVVGKDDSITLLFIAKNENDVICGGLYAVFKLQQTDPGLTVAPTKIAIGDMGPTGPSAEYSVTISSKSPPRGNYKLDMSLFSADGELVQTRTVDFIVSY